MTALDALPIAVIGGGPVGLAAAAHLIARGLPVKVYEAGPAVASNIRDWGHVRVFTPWRYCVDAAATKLLQRRQWRIPPLEAFPTGDDLVRDYIEPLADLPEFAGVIETGARVSAIARAGIDKVVSRHRGTRPFVLVIETAQGARRDRARAIIDASGTWQTPNRSVRPAFPPKAKRCSRIGSPMAFPIFSAAPGRPTPARRHSWSAPDTRPATRCSISWAWHETSPNHGDLGHARRRSRAHL